MWQNKKFLDFTSGSVELESTALAFHGERIDMFDHSARRRCIITRLNFSSGYKETARIEKLHYDLRTARLLLFTPYESKGVKTKDHKL